MSIKIIEGGVCAPIGFLAGSVHAGIKADSTKGDLALIYSKKPASCAAVYTQNKVKGAPILVTKENISDGRAQAIICNSGNANTCNPGGVDIAKETCALLAKELKIGKKNIVIASTGVIGQPMTIRPFAEGIPSLVASLSDSGSQCAAEGIMTTDTRVKEYAVSFEIDGTECHIGGIAKGSSTVHPNMATTLAFITTDCAISAEMLSAALEGNVKSTFNMISTDGESSTNDMVAVMANGMAKNLPIVKKGKSFNEFVKALNAITSNLCRKIAADGEGATKLLECSVIGAKNDGSACCIAKSVISSIPVKKAMYNADADWGRIITAIGCSGAEVDITKIDISFMSGKGEIPVCYGGMGVNFSPDFAKEILSEDEIIIAVKLGDGNGRAVALGCDMKG